MKRLLLLRHAKALPSRGETDRDRPLAPRGLADAGAVGRMIAAAGWAPDTVVVSDARRTRETLDGLLPWLDPHPVIHIEPRLYEASPETVMTVSASARADCACLLMIGHNPALATVARRSAGHGSSDDLHRLGRAFPTSALAALRFAVTAWSDIQDTSAELETFWWADRSGHAD